jgi:hypothetical protein
MVNGKLTCPDHHAALSNRRGAPMLKKILIALFTVIAVVNVAGCAGKGKTPVYTRG